VVHQPFSNTIRLTRKSRCLDWKKVALDRLVARNPSIASGFQCAFILGLEGAPMFRSGSLPPI
jgi:hypothetical protein